MNENRTKGLYMTNSKDSNRTIYIKVDEEFLDIIENILRKIGKKNNVNVGDVIAIDNYGFRKSTQEEIEKIPLEDIIDRSISTDCNLKI